MAFRLSQFEKIRPWLFHLTSRENLKRIRRTRQLQSSIALASLATNPPTLTCKRRSHTQIVIDGEVVLLRDQAPLHEGNMSLLGGWSFDDVVEDLNGRVFFWPGNVSGLIDYGIRHFEKYQAESPVLIRISSNALFAANPDCTPEFCQYNSGSPRCSGGNGSPRGPSTFREASAANFTACKVVEVTFAGQVALPAHAETSASPHGPWRRVT